jgi:hypothetical protein
MGSMRGINRINRKSTLNHQTVTITACPATSKEQMRHLGEACDLVLGHVADVDGGVAGPQLAVGHNRACVYDVET